MAENKLPSNPVESVEEGVNNVSLDDEHGNTAPDTATEGLSHATPTIVLNQLPEDYTPLIPRSAQLQAFIDHVNALGDHPERPNVLYKISEDSRAKYQQSKAEKDLSLALECGYMAIYSLRPGDPRLAKFLHNHARTVQCFWEKTRSAEGLCQMIDFYKRALDAASEGDFSIPMYLSDVGYALHRKYEVEHIFQDLVDARQYYERSLKTQIPLQPWVKATFSNNIVASLRDEFDVTGQLELLDKAISIQEEVIASLPDNAPNAWNRTIYRNLGTVYLRRFQKTNDVGDLDRAILNFLKAHQPREPNSVAMAWTIELTRAYELKLGVSDSVTDANEAVKLLRDACLANPRSISLVYSLAIAIRCRDKQFGYSTADMDEAIQLLKTCLETQSVSAEQNMLKDGLGTSLFTKYENTGSLGLLDEAIRYETEAAADETDPEQATYCHNVGNALLFRHHHLGQMNDLLNAIKSLEKAREIERTRNIKPSLNTLNCLGKAFKQKYEQTQALEDLNTAIDFHQSIFSSPVPAERNPLHLNDYANALQLRGDAYGSMNDLREAIQLYDEAYKSTPIHHPDRPMYQIGLANSLHKMYLRTGSINDLNTAIEGYRKAVDLTPDGHPNYASRLHNFAWALLNRFAERKSDSDLRDAIRLLESAIESIPQGFTRQTVGIRNTLGGAYFRAFESSKDQADLERAIGTLEEALGEVEDPALASMILSNLGAAYSAMADITHAVSDRDKAIERELSAVDLMSPDDVSRVDRMFNLATEYHRKFRDYNDTDSGKNAVQIYDEIFNTLQARPSTRLSAVIASAEIREHIDPNVNEASILLMKAVELLPEAISLDLESSDQMHLARKYYKLTSYATALALEAGAPAAQALRLLEIGRGQMLNHILESRREIESLRESHPALVERFLRARNVLYPTSRQRGRTEINTADMFGIQRKQAAAEYMEALTEIRSLQEFQGPLQPFDIGKLADRGIVTPIIAVNIHRRRSDALIITAEGISSLHLSQVKIDDVVKNGSLVKYALDRFETDEHEAQLQFERAMKWVWDCIADPILEQLGFGGAVEKGVSLPRVYWLSGGLFHIFPIHAAGDFIQSRERGELCTVMDRVISSYSPTFKALLNAQKRLGDFNLTGDEQLSAMIVAMEHTPGLLPQHQLTHALAECASVRGYLEKVPMTAEVLVNPTRDKVLSALKTCTIAHFACHAVSDPTDPSKSKLQLNDWKKAPLNYRILSKTRFPRCRLVYLSACGSAEIKNIELSDEGVSLVGGFQLADVPTVIGTSWKIGDLESARVVENFYEALSLGNVILMSKAAEALHEATRALRDEGANPLSWGAYVHYGV